MKKTITILILLILIAAIIWLVFFNRSKEKVEITNFEECVEAGNPVMESYPRQCSAGENTFTEEIGNELDKNDLIRIDSPRPNEKISSPLSISGQARGYWFFEGDFPVKLLDANENLITQSYASTKDGADWMTEDFVKFTAQLEFLGSPTEKGWLILEKDNPSGLPENADELRVPVLIER